MERTKGSNLAGPDPSSLGVLASNWGGSLRARLIKLISTTVSLPELGVLPTSWLARTFMGLYLKHRGSFLEEQLGEARGNGGQSCHGVGVLGKGTPLLLLWLHCWTQGPSI